MPVVYIVQQTIHDRDYSSAEKFGRLHFVLSVADRPSIMPEAALLKIEEALKKFREDEDYITWSGGDPIAPLLVGYVLARKAPILRKQLRYLRWERVRDPNGYRSQEGFYVPTNIAL